MEKPRRVTGVLFDSGKSLVVDLITVSSDPTKERFIAVAEYVRLEDELDALGDTHQDLKNHLARIENDYKLLCSKVVNGNPRAGDTPYLTACLGGVSAKRAASSLRAMITHLENPRKKNTNMNITDWESTKEAIQERAKNPDAKIDWFSNANRTWVPAKNPTWDYGVVYRVSKEPTFVPFDHGDLRDLVLEKRVIKHVRDNSVSFCTCYTPSLGVKLGDVWVLPGALVLEYVYVSSGKPVGREL
jgi:hypothetical protein